MYLVAIDPLALILSNDVYVKINLPRPRPDLAALRELVRSLDATEKKLVVERTKQLGEYAEMLEKALGGPVCRFRSRVGTRIPVSCAIARNRIANVH
jgi:hypothetical protein